MVVWRGTAVEPPEEHLSHMLAHLKNVAERQIGEHWFGPAHAQHPPTTGTPTRGRPAGSSGDRR